MTLTFPQTASIIRNGLRLNLFEPASLREWAYVQIERLEKPPYWVLEFATSRQDSTDLAKLIEGTEHVAPAVACGVLLAMQQIPEDLSETQIRTVTGWAYSLCTDLCSSDYQNRILCDAMSLDENYSLMKEGYIQRTEEQFRHDLMQYFQRYSLYAEAELLRPLRCRQILS